MASSGHCSVLPGLFGVAVQVLLFAVSCAVLVLKKKREELDLRGEARSWPTFLLDSSKQLVGAGWVHVANMFMAMLFNEHFEGDACEWYWVNIMLDTTLGVGIEYVLLQMITEALERATGHHGKFRTGEYRDADGRFLPSRYAVQMAVWLVCVTGMKLAMSLLMLLLHPKLQPIAHHTVGQFGDKARLELVVVMVFTPCCMNALQLWLTDNFIKKTTGARAATGLARSAQGGLHPCCSPCGELSHRCRWCLGFARFPPRPRGEWPESLNPRAPAGDPEMVPRDAGAA